MATRRASSARKTKRAGAARKSPRSRTPRKQAKAKRDDTPSRASAGETRNNGKSGKKSKADKVIRDSFTMPAAEYAVIGALKKRCVALGLRMKKSELLRAGLAMLNGMPDDRLRESVAVVASAKADHPSGNKKDKAKNKNP